MSHISESWADIIVSLSSLGNRVIAPCSFVPTLAAKHCPQHTGWLASTWCSDLHFKFPFLTLKNEKRNGPMELWKGKWVQATMYWNWTGSVPCIYLLESPEEPTHLPQIFCSLLLGNFIHACLDQTHPSFSLLQFLLHPSYHVSSPTPYVLFQFIESI